MNLQTMEYFSVLARERSFTRAAEALHITQQSLSGHIAAVEQELGAQLVCFGHTHCPTLVEEDGVTFLNPGACSGMHPTYAVAELSDGHIQHIEIKSVEETT